MDEIYHEVELGVVIGRGGRHIAESNAMSHVLGYVLALDMTASYEFDKLPMMLVKCFDTSCPIGQFIPAERVLDPHALPLKLSVNGQVRHDGNTRDLTRKIPFLVSYLSKYFTLQHGDLILTGTPAGIGPVRHGDTIEASMADLDHVKFNVVKDQ